MLITVGKQLATTLVHVLDQLSDYNQEAIHPKISNIEPYLETNRELYAPMPPKSSREVVVNITREGKAKPKASLD